MWDEHEGSEDGKGEEDDPPDQYPGFGEPRLLRKEEYERGRLGFGEMERLLTHGMTEPMMPMMAVKVM